MWALITEALPRQQGVTEAVAAPGLGSEMVDGGSVALGSGCHFGESCRFGDASLVLVSDIGRVAAVLDTPSGAGAEWCGARSGPQGFD